MHNTYTAGREHPVLCLPVCIVIISSNCWGRSNMFICKFEIPLKKNLFLCWQLNTKKRIFLEGWAWQLCRRYPSRVPFMSPPRPRSQGQMVVLTSTCQIKAPHEIHVHHLMTRATFTQFRRVTRRTLLVLVHLVTSYESASKRYTTPSSLAAVIVSGETKYVVQKLRSCPIWGHHTITRFAMMVLPSYIGRYRYCIRVRTSYIHVSVFISI